MMIKKIFIGASIAVALSATTFASNLDITNHSSTGINVYCNNKLGAPVTANDAVNLPWIAVYFKFGLQNTLNCAFVNNNQAPSLANTVGTATLQLSSNHMSGNITTHQVYLGYSALITQDSQGNTDVSVCGPHSGQYC